MRSAGLAALLLLLAGSASAAQPPPDYRATLLGAVEDEADRLIAAGRAKEALDMVHEFREEVADDARLMYEEGLIRNLLGEPGRAESLYRQALESDPSLAAAWYDLGGLLVASGELDEAEEALQRASELTVNHPRGWAAPVQLALIAAKRGDAEAMERALREAVRRGLRFTDISVYPEWTSVLRDPTLGPVLTQLITVYGEERLLQTWH